MPDRRRRPRQARAGFAGSWRERLQHVGLDRIELAYMNANHRTPQSVIAEAEPIIRAVLPDADVPTSVRGSDVPAVHGSAANMGAVLQR